MVDNDDGVIIDHTGEAGNPQDAPQLVPEIERIKARTDRHRRRDGAVPNVATP